MSKVSDLSDLKKSLNKLRLFVNFSKNGAVMNEKHIFLLRFLARRFMVVTYTGLSIEYIVKPYREQWMIERPFRTIKYFLEISPVWHSKSERIMAHVFVAALSLLISRTIEKRTDETVSHVADVFSELKAIPVIIGGKLMLRLVSISVDSVLSLLGIPVPKRFLVTH
jgi:transposase